MVVHEKKAFFIFATKDNFAIRNKGLVSAGVTECVRGLFRVPYQ